MPSPNYLSMFNFGTPWGQNPRTTLPGAPTAGAGNLQGGNPFGGAGPYGGLPSVPDPSQTQLTSILSDIQNLGGLGNLGTGINTQIANQAALPYQLNLPNYGAMTNQSSGNILSLLRGQVPQDVANQISQMGAERGIATGSIGSPNANTALLRSLGLTSLGLQTQGEQELTGAVQRTPTGQQFNPASFLTTPQTQEELQYLANLLASAPDPTQAANASILNALGGLGAGLGRGGQPGGFSYPLGGGAGLPSGLDYTGGQQPLGGGGTPGGGLGDYGTTTGPGGTTYFDPYTLDPLANMSNYPNPGLPQDMPPAGPMGGDQGWGDLFGGGDFGGF